nr:MAG TPA: hypothetical protein [Caudoviricetes sp.]
MEIQNLNRTEVMVNGELKPFEDLTHDEILLLDIKDRLQYELWNRHQLNKVIFGLQNQIINLDERIDEYEKRNELFIRLLARSLNQYLETTNKR